MNSIARRVGAIAIMGACGFYPQILSSNEFTGVQFAEWSEADQRGYISTQLVMASSIVTREKPDMSQCMAESFYDDNGLSDSGFEMFRSRISEFEAYHPSSVIVVVIENACGPFY